MKYLLTAINSKYIHSNLAVYTLKAASKEYSDLVGIREFTINNRKEQILADLYKEKPSVLFFSVYIWNVEYVIEISKEFHKLCPDVPIIAGGPEVSYDAENFLLTNPQFLGVIIGEGEATFYEIIKYYTEGGKLSEINGIAYNVGDSVCFTDSRRAIDLNSLVFPYGDDADFENRIIYYESSRGCPFSCSYCLSGIDKSLRFKDIEIVKEELKYFLDKKVSQVKFVDRTFNCNHKHVMAIWQFIKENDNGITNFHFEISADLINEQELELMKDMRPGLIQLEIGVQSVNEATIKEIHRTMKLERLEEVVRKIKSFHNIHEHLDLIAGLPYENIESFINSFNRVFALKPEQLQLGFLKVLKGSYMYEHVNEYGILYTDKPPYEVMSTKWISYDDILRLKRVEEMVEVYYNSHQFEKAVEYLETMFNDPFSFFDSLGDFYEEKGYFNLSHTRIGRCNILLEFANAAKISNEEMKCLKESLVFDIYSRENSKTRPAFADDMSLWKEATRKFCVKGKLTHVEKFSFDFPDSFETAKQDIYVMFDYEERDPLTKKAHITRLDF